MKKFLGVAVLSIVLMGGTAFAHCGKCGVGDADHSHKKEGKTVDQRADDLAVMLQLNDEQKAKVKTIMQEKADQKTKIMDEHRKSMESLHQEFQGKMKGVLTPEQVKAWEAIKGNEDGKFCPMCKDGKKCDKCMKK